MCRTYSRARVLYTKRGPARERARVTAAATAARASAVIGSEQLLAAHMRRLSKRADCINTTSCRDFNTFSRIMESMSDHSILEIIEREASNLHELVLNCIMELEKMANVSPTQMMVFPEELELPQLTPDLPPYLTPPFGDGTIVVTCAVLHITINDNFDSIYIDQ